MRCRVSSLTGPLSLSTRETVATETSARRATSRIVADLVRERGGVWTSQRVSARYDFSDWKRLQWEHALSRLRHEASSMRSTRSALHVTMLRAAIPWSD